MNDSPDNNTACRNVSETAWIQWLDRCTIEKCDPCYQDEMAQFAAQRLKSGLSKLGQFELFQNFKSPKESWYEFEKWLYLSLRNDDSELSPEQINQGRVCKPFKQKLRTKPNAATLEANISIVITRDVARDYVIGTFGSDIVDAHGNQKVSFVPLNENCDYPTSPTTEEEDTEWSSDSSQDPQDPDETLDEDDDLKSQLDYVALEPDDCVGGDDSPGDSLLGAERRIRDFEQSDAALHDDLSRLDAITFEAVERFYASINTPEKMQVALALFFQVSLAKLANFPSMVLKKSQLYNLAKSIKEDYQKINFEGLLQSPSEVWLAKRRFADQLFPRLRRYLEAVENWEFRSFILMETVDGESLKDRITMNGDADDE